MASEKLSVRFSDEEIEEIAKYLKAHPDIENVSLLIRNAVRSYLDRDAQVATVKSQNCFVDTFEITMLEKRLLDSQVEKGFLKSRDAIYRRLLTEWLGTEEKAQELVRKELEIAATSKFL